MASSDASTVVTRVFVGVDGGGTKTSVALVNQCGQVVRSAVVGATNHNSVGQDVSRANVHACLQAVLSVVSSIDAVGGVCMGISGVDREEDRVRFTKWAREGLQLAFPAADDNAVVAVPVAVHNDAVPALVAGTGGTLRGVVSISGTGTIAYAFADDGSACRASGWGPLLGDEGSGYAIGQDVLKAVTLDVDGVGPPTMLRLAVHEALKISNDDEIIKWAYSDVKWERFAQLAPLAFTLYDSDVVARAIIEKAADGIIRSVTGVVKRIGFTAAAFPLVLAGGNFTHEGSKLRQLVQQKANQSEVLKNAQVCIPSVSMEVGAALLALHTVATCAAHAK